MKLLLMHQLNYLNHEIREILTQRNKLMMRKKMIFLIAFIKKGRDQFMIKVKWCPMLCKLFEALNMSSNAKVFQL